MKEILITTETGSDLPQHIAEKLGVFIVPMTVVIDNVSYKDGTIPVDKIFDYFKATGKVPSTSAVNEHEYIEFFTKIRQEHPDSIIYHMAYSSGASSTYQACNIAKQEFDHIYLLDTKSVSGGCTAYISKAYDIIQERKASMQTDEDYQKLADDLQGLADRTACHFIPNTLEYLKAGGRVSNAKYLAATVLNIKPLIEMQDGKLVTTKKYRGSISRWVDQFFQDFTTKYNLDRKCLYLMYGKGLPQKVLDRMAENAKALGFESYEYVMTGCVVSCHGGEGAIGLAGIEV